MELCTDAAGMESDAISKTPALFTRRVSVCGFCGDDSWDGSDDKGNCESRADGRTMMSAGVEPDEIWDHRILCDAVGVSEVVEF